VPAKVLRLAVSKEVRLLHRSPVGGLYVKGPFQHGAKEQGLQSDVTPAEHYRASGGGGVTGGSVWRRRCGRVAAGSRAARSPAARAGGSGGRRLGRWRLGPGARSRSWSRLRRSLGRQRSAASGLRGRIPGVDLRRARGRRGSLQLFLRRPGGCGRPPSSAPRAAEGHQSEQTAAGKAVVSLRRPAQAHPPQKGPMGRRSLVPTAGGRRTLARARRRLTQGESEQAPCLLPAIATSTRTHRGDESGQRAARPGSRRARHRRFNHVRRSATHVGPSALTLSDPRCRLGPSSRIRPPRIGLMPTGLLRATVARIDAAVA
jgi:hypothetical protein